jgi:hypothetical protein
MVDIEDVSNAINRRLEHGPPAGSGSCRRMGLADRGRARLEEIAGCGQIAGTKPAGATRTIYCL